MAKRTIFIIGKEEAKELLQKPEKELRISEAVFVLQKRVKRLEAKLALLEAKVL